MGIVSRRRLRNYAEGSDPWVWSAVITGSPMNEEAESACSTTRNVEELDKEDPPMEAVDKASFIPPDIAAGKPFELARKRQNLFTMCRFLVVVDFVLKPAAAMEGSRRRSYGPAGMQGRHRRKRLSVLDSEISNR